MVCDSFVGFGRVFTTEFTSAGTLTALPWIDKCLPLGNSHINIIYMNGIHRDFNLSSTGVKFRHSGFAGEFILLH